MLKICPPGYVTLPWIALLALSVSIELVSSSARVTSVKFHKCGSVRDILTHRSDQGYLGPMKKCTNGLKSVPKILVQVVSENQISQIGPLKDFKKITFLNLFTDFHPAQPNLAVFVF